MSPGSMNVYFLGGLPPPGLPALFLGASTPDPPNLPWGCPRPPLYCGARSPELCGTLGCLRVLPVLGLSFWAGVAPKPSARGSATGAKLSRAMTRTLGLRSRAAQNGAGRLARDQTIVQQPRVAPAFATFLYVFRRCSSVSDRFQGPTGCSP